MCVFVGYAEHSKAYRFLDLESNVVIEFKEAEFFEYTFISEQDNEYEARHCKRKVGEHENPNICRDRAPKDATFEHIWRSPTARLELRDILGLLDTADSRTWAGCKRLAST
ncbi:hypothetical protein AMTR_s00012p00203480 [Amborella trichopoda]|uniref:Retroviral polymerase SH3-like domain-containing protein n=1 Tax=Amborella trichopoda TaxID=13333 RepID=W1PL40_AMBTC|nr:hypothetical protein AMTR_s00012p00203480 [Amborella trichopoda]